MQNQAPFDDIIPHTDEVGCMCPNCRESEHNGDAPASAEPISVTKSRINTEPVPMMSLEGTPVVSEETDTPEYTVQDQHDHTHGDHDHETDHDHDHEEPTLDVDPDHQQAGADPNPYNTPNTNGTDYADDPVDGLMGSSVWDTTNLTFSFPTAATDYESGYGDVLNTMSGLGAQAIGVARATLDEYAAISGLTFTELTGDSVSGTPGERIIDADLRFARTDDAGTAYAYYPSGSVYGGDSWYNTGSYNSPTIGNYSYHTFLHEVGHALGLKHGQSTSGPGAVPYEMDSMEFTVMTYRSFVGKDLNYGYANGTWDYAQSLMMLDIAAIQRLYGANFETNGDDSVYTFSATTGEMFVNGVGVGTPGGNRVFRTVWDGDGEDTYDLSNYTTNLAIDLAPGGFSEFDADGNFQRALLDFGYQELDPVYARGHLFNAMQFEGDSRSLIENAIGGSGNDAFNGNAADNSFEGRGGNDSFTDSEGSDSYSGGEGTDTVFFGLSFEDYAFELTGAFLRVIDTAIDFVENTIAWLTFSNASYTFQQIVDTLEPGGNNTPVGVNDSRTVAEDTLTTIDVTANDTDADADDLTVTAINGQAIATNGSVTLASGAIVTLLSNGTLRYDQNGAFDDLNTGQNGADSFTYRLSDGVATDTATVSVTITGATDNVAPVGNNDSASVAEDGTVNGSVLGNDTDGNGDSLSVTAVNGASPGGTITLASGARVTMQSNGTYSYDPNGAFDALSDGQSDTDSFTYTVSDGRGGTDTATVTITINGTGEPVFDNALLIDFEGLAVGDYLGESGLDVTGMSTIANTELSGSRVGLVNGNVDAEISFSGGTLDFNSATFTSASGRARVEIFAYDENGGLLGSSVFNVRSDRDVSRSFDATFDGAARIVINPSSEIFIDNMNIVTHVAGDGTGNMGPLAINDILGVDEGAILSGNVLADNGFGADSDPNGDPLTIISVEGDTDGTVTLASGATVTFNANGTFSYDQNGAFEALHSGQTDTDSFTYTVSDGNGGTDTATVQIEVQGVGTPPPVPTLSILTFDSGPDVNGFEFTNLELDQIKRDNVGVSVGDEFILTHGGDDFSFDMAMLRAVSERNTTALVEAWNDGVLVATQTLTINNRRDVELVTSDPAFDAIDELRISASGGVYVDDMFLSA